MHSPLQTVRDRSWGWLLKRWLLPLGDRAFGQRMMQKLAFLEQAQWWDRERIERFQQEQLQQLIDIAYTQVPLYRELMDAQRLAPRDIRTVADLRKLPIVTKTMLRDGFPNRICRSTGQKTYQVSTSGSTGQSLHLLEDAQTAGWYRATFLLMLEWAGWHFGEAHVQTGITLTRSLDRKVKDALMRCHYISAYELSDDKLDVALDILEKYRIEHLWGYPGSLYCLARRARQQGWNRPLRSVVTWGDMLFPAYRQCIEQAFSTHIYDTFGCSEGVHISGQCGTEQNYHVHDLDVVVEYVDAQGEPVKRGQPGSLLLTRLYPGVTPLIRYRNGDVATASTQERCACGRALNIMLSIQGRDADVVVTPEGNRLIVQFFTSTIKYYPQIEYFQVLQNKVEEVTLRLVPRADYSPDVADRLVADLRQRGADGLTFNVEVVDEIPLSPAGKRRFIITTL